MQDFAAWFSAADQQGSKCKSGRKRREHHRRDSIETAPDDKRRPEFLPFV
jgi:hypothetical protein